MSVRVILAVVAGLVTAALLVGTASGARPCNEVVCASIVSKCLLTQACKCDLTNHPDNNCTCCYDCAKCLGYLLADCCSCLGMCEPNRQSVGRTDSQVGDLHTPFNQLFKALAEDKDALPRWSSMTFPIDVTLTDPHTSHLDHNKYRLVAHTEDTTPEEQYTINCTVIYHSQCTSADKCKDFCSSAGAAAYRWFFDGCCECVGSNCINYGVNESRCLQCPETMEEPDDDLTDQHLAAHSPDDFNDAALQGDLALDDDATL